MAETDNKYLTPIPEHGVVRKRSIRRKISRDDKVKEIQFGIYPDEYDKICERVTSEKHFRNSIDGLQERWRMIMFMYEDCMEMVKDWEIQCSKRKQTRQRQRLYVYLALSSTVVIPLLLLILFICWHFLL